MKLTEDVSCQFFFRISERGSEMEAERKLLVEAEAIFREGVALVLSRWSATSSPGSLSLMVLYIDDLEDILNEAMLYLNIVTEDGNIEEVAEKLMFMNEECLNGDFKSVESLREANHRRVARPHVKQVDDDDDDDDDDDNYSDDTLENDGPSNMMLDAPESRSNSNPVDMTDNKLTPKPVAKTEDGWEVVGLRRGKGKRN